MGPSAHPEVVRAGRDRFYRAVSNTRTLAVVKPTPDRERDGAADDPGASFISWMAHCRRSDTIAAALNGPSHLIRPRRPNRAALRYPLQLVRSLRALRRDAPAAVMVASPPFLAPLAAWIYSSLRRVPFAIDAHSGVFNDPRWSWAMPLNRFLSRRAAATIVTGPHYRDLVASWGARPLVIGAVPCRFREDVAPADLGEGVHVVFPCTWSFDEPVDRLFDAARRTPEVTVHITGRPKGPAAAHVADAPDNVRLAGWLSDDEYTALMKGCDAVLALTSRDHTMQRAGEESLEVGKPLICSGWSLLRETFPQGALFVDNSADQLADALAEMARRHDELAEEMVALRPIRVADYERGLDELRRLLGDHPALGAERTG